uniref:Uncharacterized protein n=1 Tax=Timema douglasi TaxID=61478 RepID=A0A7R8VUB2_TIMDO|nr:unnamed protein product [Timema douglasi]
MYPLDQLLWLEYVHFADRHLAPPDTVLGVCSRSTRNCPWFTELWRQKLFLMEKYHQSSHEDMQAVKLNTTSALDNYATEAGMWREYMMLKFPTENLGSDHKLLVVDLDGDSGVLEQALAVEYTSASDYLLLWLAYADYMRRRIEQDSDQQDQQVTAFTELLAQACEHLAQRFGLKGDPQCILLQYWARIEAAYKGDMEKVRLLWNDIMTQGHSQFAEMWLEYILLERIHGDTKHLRRLYARALRAVEDTPDKIATAWVNFERDKGTLESYQAACDAYKERNLLGWTTHGKPRPANGAGKAGVSTNASRHFNCTSVK